MPVTIKEIAEKAGVSYSVVSSVINEDYSHTRVGKETRKKVKAIAKTLNFHPNQLARSLRSGKKQCIGALVTGGLADFNDLATAHLYAGIGRVVDSRDHYLTIFPLGKENFEKMILKIARSRMVDGLIIRVYPATYDRFIKRTSSILRKEKIPFVAVDTTTQTYPCPSVGFNAPRAGYLAARHLAGQGLTDIGFIHDQDILIEQLYQGYNQCMKESGLDSHRVQFGYGHYSNDARVGYEQGKKVLGSDGIRQGYVVYSDAMAYGLVRALTESGKKVPGDVRVVGCDDLFKDNMQTPFLTSVDRKFEEIGGKAAEMLFRVINHPQEEPESYIAEPELKVRASSNFPVRK